MAKTYIELLKDPRWQKKRLKTLDRDNWQCQACGLTTDTMHVHHIKYFKGDPWDCPDEYLISLCENCHATEEDLKKEPGLFYDSVKDLGLTRVNLLLLMQHIRFVMSTTEGRPFDVFNNQVLSKIVPNDRIKQYMAFCNGEKGKKFNG